MILYGVVRNGVIVPDSPMNLPDGTEIEFVLTPQSQNNDLLQKPGRRVGGILKGKIEIAPDFDEWPDDIREAFGMNDP